MKPLLRTNEFAKQVRADIAAQIVKYKFCPNCGKELVTLENQFPSCEGHGAVFVRDRDVVFRLLRTQRG